MKHCVRCEVRAPSGVERIKLTNVAKMEPQAAELVELVLDPASPSAKCWGR